LPKSKRRAFVGYDEGSNSVLYYNAETRTILTSRNYRFLSPSTLPPPPEEIAVEPDSPREGEQGGNTSLNRRDGEQRENLKRKSEDTSNEPRKTRGKRVDYEQLNDPYPPDFDDDLMLTADIVYAIIAGDEITSLKEAKKSSDWPQWEKAIQAELTQLNNMGTWELVDKPPDAIPVANKWVFIRKRNKLGEIVKYKARLVAKGYSQRPGQDYNETYSPVVRLDTLRAILALVPAKKLKVQQMDIKGAYLNGYLKERVFMKQPEGFEDGTGRVCRLVKTLYGLKQSGQEWNSELNAKLLTFGFT
jgi:hypothetical protein